MFVFFVLSCLFLEALWSHAGKRADLLAFSCVPFSLLFCHFPKCALVHIRINGEVGAVNMLKPSNDFY